MKRGLLRKAVEYLPALAQFLRNSRDLLDRHDPPVVTPWGFSLAGHDAMANGMFERAETEVVRRLLQDVDMLINVGANVGYYCCHALSLGKQVVAIEPVFRNLHYLLANVRNNGWSEQIEIFPVALGSGPNILEMWGGGTGASLIKGWASIPESYVTHVPVLSLDRVLGTSIAGKKTLIVVDIEGAELMMLRGAANTLLSEPRPIWLMEICSTEHQPAETFINPNFVETFEFFYNRGYRAFTADELALEVSAKDVKEIASRHRLIGTHNFIFKC